MPKMTDAEVEWVIEWVAVLTLVVIGVQLIDRTRLMIVEAVVVLIEIEIGIGMVEEEALPGKA